MDETVHASPLRPVFAYLIVVNGDRAGDIIQLEPGRGATIGRGPHHTVRLDDPTVSADHARIRCDGEGAFTFVDMGSENGARVNGRTVRQHALRHNDSLEVGRTRMVFKLVGAEVR